MSTIVTRSGKGSALSTSEMDANLTNLNTDKLENVVADTTPQLGGDLTVNGNSIVSLSNGNIAISPHGTGKVVAKRLQVSDGTEGNISVDVADGNLNLSAGSGTGTVNITSTTGIQVSADGSSNANVFTASTNGNLKLTSNGTGVIISEKNHLLTTGNLIAANGTDLTLSTQGATDVIVLNQTGGVVLTDTGASGKGVITGASSKGVAIATNGGAQAVTDPIIGLDSGGGATISAGVTSALALVGSTVGITGTTTVSNLKTFTETVHTSTTTTGTYAPTIADGTIHNVTMTGSMTINAFTSPADGQTITLFFNGTGGSYTLTLGSNIKTPAGTLALTDGGLDIVTITCIDATTPIYVATAINNFQ